LSTGFLDDIPRIRSVEKQICADPVRQARP
jgi:hypothetical protein